MLWLLDHSVNLVYESVGGAQFEAAVSNLSIKGKLLVIGFISGYKDRSGFSGSGLFPSSSTWLMLTPFLQAQAPPHLCLRACSLNQPVCRASS